MKIIKNKNAQKKRGQYKCLLLVRISSPKQSQTSDSPEHQIRKGLDYAKTRFGFYEHDVLILSEMYSARKEEHPYLDEAETLVKLHGIEVCLFFDIDRFTRAGAAHYEITKKRFKSIGCEIVDVNGIIQPERNTLAGSGGEFGKDFEYEWSVYATSEKAEILAAQEAKDEARKILGRTIPIQIRNAQVGRTVRPALYGYRNIKIVDESGKPQGSKEVNEEEAFFVRKIFERMAATQDTRLVCDEINKLGFLTRKNKKWNANHSQVIGYVGGRPLNPKSCREMVSRVVYAGFIQEKWTHGLPVKANHEGLVSIELWNATNEGHLKLIESKSSLTGWRLVNVKADRERRQYLKERPDFPFKKLIKCPHCKKALKASYSRGRSGERFGYYHCNRGHKHVSINKKNLLTLLGEYLGSLKFSPEVAERFEKHIRDVWLEKAGDLNRHLAFRNHQIAELRDKAESLIESIKLITEPHLVSRLEQDYKALRNEIEYLESDRKQKEFTEEDQNGVIAWARYMVEHLDELVLNTDDECLRAVFWSLIFPENPTLEEIANRTAQTSDLVKASPMCNEKDSGLVSPAFSESNQIYGELMRWAEVFKTFHDQIHALINADTTAKSDA